MSRGLSSGNKVYDKTVAAAVSAVAADTQPKDMIAVIGLLCEMISTVFRVKWFDTSNKGRKVNKLVLRNNMTQIDCSREAFKDDQYILMSSADVARSHDGNGGGEDRPPPPHVPTGCGGCFINRGKGTRKPNLGGRGAGRMNTRDQTRNLSLKEVAKAKGPVSIQFDVGDKQTLNSLGPHAAHWSNTWGGHRTVPLYYPSWEKAEGVKGGAHFKYWALAKSLQHQQGFFQGQTLEGRPQIGTYDVEAIRQTRPEEITADEWDKDPGRWLRLEIDGQASVTKEEMKRLEATGEYTEDEINALARGGKLRGHIPGVGRVLPSRATSRPSMPAPDKSLKSMHRKVDFMMSLFRSDSKYSDMFKEFESGGASGSGGCGDDEEGGDDEDGEDEDDDGESCDESIQVQEVRWNKNLPIKVNIHTWRLFLDRLPTRYNLDIRGIDLDSTRCPICDNGIETANHVFMDCSVAIGVWDSISSWWGVNDCPKDLQNLIC
ncbi:F-box domain containing protein [Tanacetum coccineum]